MDEQNTKAKLSFARRTSMQLVEKIGFEKSSWPLERVDNIFDLQQGAALSPKRRQGIDPHPFLRTSNVLWGHLDLSTVDCMDFSPDEVAKLALKKGDLLTCEGGEIGRTAMWKDELPSCYYQNHIHRLRSNGTHQIIPEFYMYWMQAAFLLLDRYRGQGNKTTIANLSGSRLNSFLVPYPPFQEQRAVAKALRAVQEAKAARQREMGLQQERKAALMQHLFTYGTRNEPILETEIGAIPANWNIEGIGSLLREKVKNGLYKLNTLDGDGNAQLIQLSDLFGSDRILNFSDLRAVELEPEEIDAYLIKNNDCIVNRVSKRKEGIGKVAVAKISDNALRIVFESNMFRLRLDDEKIDVDYFSFFSEDLRYRQQAQRKSQKGNQTSINQAALKSILIPIPPIDEQREIVKILSFRSAAAVALQKEKELLEELFKSLLEQLMTGRLSAEPLIEVATDE
jgi:type I restriction enzyme, S subunit